MDYGEIGWFYNLSSDYDVMILFAAPQHIDIVAVSKAMHVPEKSVAMAGDHGIPERPWDCCSREMTRPQQKGMCRRALEHNHAEVNSRN